MKKQDYLKLALSSELPLNLAWIFSAFCVTRTNPRDHEADPYRYRIVSCFPKYQFLNADGKLEDLDDAPPTSEPLFTFKERVEVDSSWAANIQESTPCVIGNLIFNAVAVLPAFGTRFPFTIGKLNIGTIEKMIADRLVDTPAAGAARDPKALYVDEYLHFRDGLVYLEQLAPIVSWSATRKGITAPAGLSEYRDQLLLEYDGRLNDPAVFAEYEDKLKKFDKAWLSDDPAMGTFLKGKVLDISRKKMFLAIGIPDRLDPKEPIVPITRTLEEGQPTDPKQYAAALNGARFGSFSRGSETKNGGVISKLVIRVGSAYQIDLDDCGTKLGLRKVFNRDSIGRLLGRTIVTADGLVTVEKTETAANYIDQPLIIRSPAYCQAGPGDRLCKMCCGPALSQYKEGLVIGLTEVSQLILTQSLKAMHGRVLSTAKVDLQSALS